MANGIACVCHFMIADYNYKLCNLPRQDRKLYGPFLWMGCNCLKAIQSHYKEKFLVLIRSMSEGWKAEMTLKPSVVLNLRINLVITKYKLKSQLKLTQLWPLTVNSFKVSSQSYLAGLWKMFPLYICRPNDHTIEIIVLLQIQFYDIVTNVLSIIFKRFH